MQWKSPIRIRLTIVALAVTILAGGAVLLIAAPGTVAAAPDLLAEEPAPPGAAREFKTDFTRHTVPYSDVLSGGPPKDGIPAIDVPASSRWARRTAGSPTWSR